MDTVHTHVHVAYDIIRGCCLMQTMNDSAGQVDEHKYSSFVHPVSRYHLPRFVTIPGTRDIDSWQSPTRRYTSEKYYLPDNPFLPGLGPRGTRNWMLERMKEDPFPINTQRRLRCRQRPSVFHSVLSLRPVHRLLATSKGERERVRERRGWRRASVREG